MAISKEIKDKLKPYGIDGINLSSYQVLLDGFGYTLSLVEIDGHSYLVFLNINGETQAIDTDYFGQVLAFTFCEDDDDFKSSSNRIESLSASISADESIVNFSKTALEYTINSLNKLILEQTLGISPEDLSYYSKLFDQYGVILDIELIGENPILIFKGKDGQPKELSSNGNKSSYLGFIFSYPDEEKNTFQARKKYIEQKYRRLLFNDKISFLKYSEKSWHHFIDGLHQDEKQKEQKVLTRAEEGDITELKGEVLDYLNSIFEGTGHKAVFADSKVYNGTQLVSTERFPLVDILIISAGDDMSFKPVYLDLYGWKAKKELPFDELIPYGDVCGIVIVDNEESLFSRKEIRRKTSSQLRHYYPTEPNGKVLTVDRNLLNRWKKMKSPEVIPEVRDMAIKLLPERQSAAYGLRKKSSGRAEHYYIMHEPFRSRIGGHQGFLVSKETEDYSKAVVTDFGYPFDINPAWGGIGSGPSYSDGIMPFLRSGMFPQTRRLYRPDLLQTSLRPVSIDNILDLAKKSNLGNKFGGPDEFLVLEIFHYYGEEVFMTMLQQSMPTYLEQIRRRGKIPGLLKYLEQRDQQLYSQKTVYDALLLTHAHQDHAIGSSLVREDILRGWSPITRALLLADHKLANAWYVQDTAARKKREEDKIGASYQVTEYPFINLLDGQRTEVVPGTFVTGFDVYHSIPGAQAHLIEKVGNSGAVEASVLYCGDYRNGDVFDRIGRSRPVDLLVIEGTNPPNGKKESTSYDEAMVRDNLAEVIEEVRASGKLLVIDLVKNNVERLNSIIEEATVRGRTIVVSPKIAWRCEQIMLQQMDWSDDEKTKLPDFSNPNILIWKKPMSRYTPHDNDMIERYGHIDQDGISAVPEQYLLVRDGGEQSEKLEGIQAEAIWILSIYGTYDHIAAQQRRHIHKSADQFGWDLRTTGFHATGHAPLLKADHPEADGGVLHQLNEAQAKNAHGITRQIVITHTQKRQAVAEALRSYKALAKVPIHDKVKHPWNTIDLNND